MVEELRRGGRDLKDRGLHARCAVLAALRRADRAADLAPVVHAHGRARRAGDRGRARGEDPLSPAQLRARVPELDGEHPSLVHLTPALVGPPDSRLVSRRRRSTSARAAPEGEGWERDPDVLDTWFSSGLFPFAALGWPNETPELRAFYPTDVLVTGREIVFLWVARMIMLGLEFLDEIPFTDVYVHAIIHAPDGRRMSKSLGTGVDPLALIDGGPRPPVFGEGSAHPATSRRTARTACASGCWRCPRART